MFLSIGRNRAITRFIVIIAIISSADSWTFDYDDQEPVLEPESSFDVNNFDTLPKTDQSDFTDPMTHRFDSPKTDPVAPSTTNDLGVKGNKPIDDRQEPIDDRQEPVDDQQEPVDDQEKPILPIFGSKEKIEEGRRRYEVMKSEAPKYGACWTNAIQSLHVGCSRLNDDSQARMGLSFANCFLQKVGSKTYPCSVDRDMKWCVRSMDDRAFNTYIHFYTHTQSICFFLANQVWQESTSRVVDKLSETSVRVSDRLVYLQGLQEESISAQMNLNEEMSQSKERLQSLGESLKEKQVIEMEILKRFMEVKGFILSEISKVYSLGFYLFSIITVYLITTPVRTNSARFWILLLFATNLAVERYIVSNILSPRGTLTQNIHDDTRNIHDDTRNIHDDTRNIHDDTRNIHDDTHHIHDLSSEIDELTWICRKATCIISTLLIFIFWFTYRDYGQLNHGLLSQLHHQQKDLIRSASEIKNLQFLQLQRMGLESNSHPCPSEPISHPCPSEPISHLCPSHGGQESDSDPCEVEPVRHGDIMSDFSDLDSGHEEGPCDTDSVIRIKSALKKRKKETNRGIPGMDLDTMFNGQPVQKTFNGQPLQTMSNGQPLQTMSNGQPLQTMSNGQPVQKFCQKSNQVIIYSPTTTYKLRERKPRATPLSQVRTKVVPKVEPATPTKRLEFSDDD